MNITRLVFKLYRCNLENPSLNSCEFLSDKFTPWGGRSAHPGPRVSLIPAIEQSKYELTIKSQTCKMWQSARIQIAVTPKLAMNFTLWYRI